MEQLQILKITFKALRQYYSQFGYTKDTLYIRKRMTRDFILGTEEIKRSSEEVKVRWYGNLKIVVNMETSTIIGIFHNTEKVGKAPINYEYKRQLSELYGIPCNAKEPTYLQDYSHLKLSMEDLYRGEDAFSPIEKADEVRRLYLEGLSYKEAAEKVNKMLEQGVKVG